MFKKWLTLSNLLNLATLIVVGIFVIKRMPSSLKMFEFQGKPAPAAHVGGLRGSAFSLPQPGKHAVIFWATWCGPCKVELARVNQLVIDKKIKPDSVLAISIGEDPRLVADVITQRGYLFDIGVDPKSEAAGIYDVNVTPTVLLVDQDARVKWMTAGLSPTLELRFKSFFD